MLSLPGQSFDVVLTQTNKETVGVTRVPTWNPQLIFLQVLVSNLPLGITGVIIFFNWMAH